MLTRVSNFTTYISYIIATLALSSRMYEKYRLEKSVNFWRLPISSILYIDLIEFSENPEEEVQLRRMLFQCC